MNNDDDETLLDRTLESGALSDLRPGKEIEELFHELEGLLKNGDVVGVLTLSGVNASLALLALDALRAYLAGRKADAAEDFATVAEEIRGRLAGAGNPGAH